MPHELVQLIFNRCGKIVFDREAVRTIWPRKEQRWSWRTRYWGLTNYSFGSTAYYIIIERYKLDI